MQKKWEITKDRFVAFIDILGFKEFVAKIDNRLLYSKLKKINNYTSYFEEDNNASHLIIKEDADVSIINFSDSIFIFTENDNIANFNYIIDTVIYLFQASINLEFPLKGAISHGQITIDKERQIYFGQPIIDAYLLEQELQYMGVVTHHSFDKYLKENEIFFERPYRIFRNKTSFSKGYFLHNNINWFCNGNKISSLMKNLICQEKKELIEKIALLTSGNARKYCDNTIEVIENYFK